MTIKAEGAVSRYKFGTETAQFYVCTTCGVAPLVVSEIDGRAYSVVNSNTFDDIDPELLHCSPSDFEGEDSARRLERRQRNWIATVRISRT